MRLRLEPIIAAREIRKLQHHDETDEQAEGNVELDADIVARMDRFAVQGIMPDQEEDVPKREREELFPNSHAKSAFFFPSVFFQWWSAVRTNKGRAGVLAILSVCLSGKKSAHDCKSHPLKVRPIVTQIIIHADPGKVLGIEG